MILKGFLVDIGYFQLTCSVFRLEITSSVKINLKRR